MSETKDTSEVFIGQRRRFSIKRPLELIVILFFYPGLEESTYCQKFSNLTTRAVRCDEYDRTEHRAIVRC